MAGSATTQFYTGVVLVGGLRYPVYGGTISCDPQYDIPAILGNYAQFNFGQGQIQPIVDLNFVVRDENTTAGQHCVLNSTLLGPFLNARSAIPAHDTTEITSGITFFDGRDGWTVGGVKADSFTISASKGGPIQFSGRYVGTTITRITSTSAFTAWEGTNLLRFKAANFSGAMANIVWNFALSYSNNHTPDQSLNGSLGPIQWNAGMPTAGLQVTVQASDAATLAGYLNSDGTGSGGLYGGSIPTLAITGTGAAATFTMGNLLAMNPNSRNTAGPRIMRNLQYTVLAATGQAMPLSVSTNFSTA